MRTTATAKHFGWWGTEFALGSLLWENMTISHQNLRADPVRMGSDLEMIVIGMPPKKRG
jgi:hypothetical protein